MSETIFPGKEREFGKGVIATGLGMSESNSLTRLVMKMVELRFKKSGLPMETFWSEWESLETFEKKLQRITDRVEKSAANGLAVPVMGMSMGEQLALRVAGLEKKHVNGIVGIVPVARGIGQDGGKFDSQYRRLAERAAAPHGSYVCGEAVANIEEYLSSGALRELRSMCVISGYGHDKLVLAGMSMLPGAVLFPKSQWAEVRETLPREPRITIETPYKGHALAGGFIMLFATRMIVERFKQDAEIRRTEK